MYKKQNGGFFHLLLTGFLMLVLNLNLVAQTNCNAPVTRSLTNAKSTNANPWDDIGAAMTNLLSDSSETAWLFESGATFTENTNGTASLKGTLKQFGDLLPVRRLQVDLVFSGKTFTAPNPPHNVTGVPIDSWYYYPTISGTMSGLDALAGGVLNISVHMAAAQVGIGGNQITGSIEDQTLNGGGGWFEWVVTTQPTGSLRFNNYNLGVTIADLAFLLSGPPSVPPCAAVAGSVSLTGSSTVNLVNGSAQVTTTVSNNSTVPAGSQIGYVLSKNGIVLSVASAPNFTVNSVGNYCVHVLVYNPATLNFAIQYGTTNIADMVQLIENQCACAKINTNGTCINVQDDPCVNDQTPPSFSQISQNITVTAPCNASSANATWIIPTATDNCGTPSVTSSHNSGSAFAIGTTTVIYKATDAKGNTATATFTVTVSRERDNTAPIFSNCPANQTVNIACNVANGRATWTAPTATETCGTVTVTSTHNSGASFPVGTTTVTYTATNSAGLTATCSFTISLIRSVDNTPPTFSNCPANQTVNVACTASNGTATWTAPSAFDNCSTPSVIASHQSGAIFAVGTTTVTYTATNAVGLKATCAFTVTVVRQTGTPSFRNCPVDITKDVTGMTGTCWTVAIAAPTATDGCGNNLAVTSSHAANFCFPIGTTTVTYTARTASGQTITCSVKIIIKRNDPCAGIASIRSAKSTWDICGGATRQGYVMYFEGKYYTAGTNLKFTEYTNGTATLKGSIHRSGYTYAVNVTFGGKTNASSGSPKIELCATGKTNGSGWYYYTTTNGTVGTASGIQTISRKGPAFQVGQFANLQENTYGASGWFMTTSGLSGDFNINLGAIEACGTTTPPTTCTTTFDGTKTYKIVNRASGKALDISGSSTVNDAKSIQWNYNATANQKWKMVSVGSGYYKMVVQHSSKVLACHNTANGSWVYQYDYYSGGYKDWSFECLTGGYVRIKHRASGRYLCFRNTSDGTQASIDDWNGANAMQWQVVEVSNSNLALMGNQSLTMNAKAEATRSRLEFVSNQGATADFYTVQKMNAQTGEFEDLKVINNDQTNIDVQFHTAFDESVTEGDNIYRTKVTLASGDVHVSANQKVNFKGLLEVRTFPNPATDYVEIDLSNFAGRAVSIYLYNEFGTLVSTNQISEATKTPFSLDLNAASAGNYLIRVAAEGKREVTKRIVVAK